METEEIDSKSTLASSELLTGLVKKDDDPRTKLNGLMSQELTIRPDLHLNIAALQSDSLLKYRAYIKEPTKAEDSTEAAKPGLEDLNIS